MLNVTAAYNTLYQIPEKTNKQTNKNHLNNTTDGQSFLFAQPLPYNIYNRGQTRLTVNLKWCIIDNNTNYIDKSVNA